jgi:uridine kinase
VPARRCSPRRWRSSCLQRPELVDLWDVAVFVEADLEVAARRGAERNLVWFDSVDETLERYLPAQRRYLEEHQPHERANLVFENTDLTTPRLTRRPRSGP